MRKRCSTNRKMLFFSHVLVTLLLVVSTDIENVRGLAYELTIEVGAGKQECFYQPIHVRGTDIEIEYQVLDGSGMDIGFTLKSPQGVVIRADVRRTDKVHEVRLDEEGVYEICFDNRFSQFTNKLVFFDIYSEIPDKTFPRNSIDGVVQVNQEHSAELMDMTVSQIMNSLDGVGEHIQRSKHLQHSLAAYMSQDRIIQERVFERERFDGMSSTIDKMRFLQQSIRMSNVKDRFVQETNFRNVNLFSGSMFVENDESSDSSSSLYCVHEMPSVEFRDSCSQILLKQSLSELSLEDLKMLQQIGRDDPNNLLAIAADLNISSNAVDPKKKSPGKRIYMPGKVRLGKPSSRAICINFITVVVSTVGLIMLVACYACLGGAIFEWLEASNENDLKSTARVLVGSLVKRFSAELYAQIQIDASNQTIDTVTTITSVLRSLAKNVSYVANNDYWDGELTDKPIAQDWTFAGALLFSVTTITTIGYGFIAPKTVTGKIICIFYSIFGIPITMLCIANLGLWFARQVRKMHRTMKSCCNQNIDEVQLTEVPVVISLIIMVGYILGGAALFSQWETNITFIDGAYFCFITLTTIGFGDIVPGVYTGKGDWTTGRSSETVKLIVCGLYLFFGLALLAMCMDLMKEEVRANAMWLGYKTNLMKQKTAEEIIDEYIRQQIGE